MSCTAPGLDPFEHKPRARVLPSLLQLLFALVLWPVFALVRLVATWWWKRKVRRELAQWQLSSRPVLEDERIHLVNSGNRHRNRDPLVRAERFRFKLARRRNRYQ